MADKIAYIMRGLPGSGKSTLARTLCPNEHCIFSTDSYFIIDGEYVFDRNKLGRNHMQNLADFSTACGLDQPIVVCDNTNIKKKDYGKYIATAELHGYQIRIVIAGEWGIDTCHARCTHDVPKETIARMREQFIL